jgi:hypothetical protein
MANESNPRPEPEATILMSSTALKRPEPPPAAVRLHYIVRAVGDQWEVVFEDVGQTIVFPTKHDALLEARSQARERWSAHGQPSRVSQVLPDGSMTMVALYGSDTPAEKPASP